MSKTKTVNRFKNDKFHTSSKQKLDNINYKINQPPKTIMIKNQENELKTENSNPIPKIIQLKKFRTNEPKIDHVLLKSTIKLNKKSLISKSINLGITRNKKYAKISDFAFGSIFRNEKLEFGLKYFKNTFRSKNVIENSNINGNLSLNDSDEDFWND